MEQIALIVVAFSLGYLLREMGVFNLASAHSFNRFVIYVSFPALVLLKIHTMQMQSGLFIPISMAWIHFGLAALLFYSLGKFLNWDQKTAGALILTGGLGNTSFVGFPLLETFYGKEFIPTAILLDQLGTFLVLSLLGVPVAIYFSGGAKHSITRLLMRIIKFPPFIALVVAFILIPFTYPEWLNLTLEKLSATLIPLALFSVGLQTKLNRKELKSVRLPLFLGLLFKLVLAPLALAALYIGLIGSHEPTTIITVYLSAMAPMITAGIVASENGLNPPLTNLMLGVGIPLSLLTSTAWYFILR